VDVIAIKQAAPVLLALVVPAIVAAQPAQPEQPAGPPRHEDRSRVTAPIGQAGATMALGNGAEIFLPPGLPIGSSRLLTFAGGRTVNARNVHDRFVRVGPTLSFDGAINATRAPMVVSIPVRRFSARNGSRLVLAMEQPGLCGDANRNQPLGNDLCSVWELVPATYDEAAGRVRANLSVSGGLRLQFGWVPEAAEPAP
jgi:hypothetical protein